MSALREVLPELPEHQVAAPPDAVDVSIIIPAFNEARVIARCLESLAQLDFPRRHFEVIVVDNGSRDATLSIAESFHDRIDLRTFKAAGVYISALRNLGCREARGRILAFLDADCVAPRRWLRDVMDLMLAQAGGVAGAHYLLPDGSSWVGRTWHKYQEAPKSGDVSHVPAGDLIVRRLDFLRVGGFDESVLTNEDYELCHRVRAAGMPVRAFPRLGVVHLGTAQSLSAFYRKQLWHGTHVMKVFLRDPLGSHNRKAVLFAVFTLLASVVILGGAAWAVFGGSWLVPLGGVIALILPAVCLSAVRVVRPRMWADFLPLSALYLAYGLARAHALLKVKNLF